MSCKVCDKNTFSLAVDLNEQPLANIFLKKDDIGKENRYPLRLIYCHHCCTAQLDCSVKKEEVFTNHTYLSGMTASLKKHFENIAGEVDTRFFKDKNEKSVLDIGSNDGSQLIYFQQLGYDVLGVEAAKAVADIANKNGVPTRYDFFNLETADKINRHFDVINAAGVFFHLEELHSVTEAIKKYLKEDGVFTVQFMYMKNIMDNGAFDQIYHEHLLFYTLQTIEYLLNRHGLALFDAYLSPIHGGSVMGFVSHQGKRPPSERLQKMRQEEALSGYNTLEAYAKFAKKIAQVKEVNLSFLEKCKREGKTIYGMGAPVKGNTLLNYFDIGTETLDYLIEKNELRRDLYSPGKHIPIAIERELKAPPDVYYVLAWNFKDEILKNNQRLIEQGVEFYFPINPK